MLFQNAYGIDLGTDTVKICDQSAKHRITKEKNMVAVRGQNEVFAVGNDAYAMFERNPEDIRIVTPMVGGRINNLLLTEALLHTLLRRSDGHMHARSVLYFSVPMDMTELERRAYASIAKKGQLRRCQVWMVEKPIADAITLGIPIHRTRGSMIINIGARSTDLSVIADKRVIINRMIPIGGDSLSTAILDGILMRNQFLMSFRTAQRLKLSCVNLQVVRPEGIQVKGIDVSASLPGSCIVQSSMVNALVKEELTTLTDEIRRFLDRLPPQILQAVRQEGFYLAGGSSQIPGIGPFMHEKLDSNIHVSKEADLCTITGLREIIMHEELQHWAFAPRPRR